LHLVRILFPHIVLKAENTKVKKLEMSTIEVRNDKMEMFNY